MSKLKILGDKACPSCRSHGRDSKGNHLILFESDLGERFGKCNKCGHYEGPEGDLSFEPRPAKTPEQLQEELEAVSECPIRALTSRGIKLHTADRYGVRVGLSEADGSTVTEHYYPRHREGEVVAYNTRNLDPKCFYYRGSPRGGTEPFGYQQANMGDVGRKRLIIFEDELSAMSGYQIIEERTPDKWKHLKPACISWSAGVGSDVRDLDFMEKMEFLSKFQDLVYCHDNDEPGRESAERVRSLIPTMKFIWMPLKDVNDMLMDGRDAEAFSLMVFQGRTKSPDCAVEVHDVREEALKPVEYGLSYPWDGLTELTFGQRPSLVAIGGGTGSGKTLLAHEITAHNILVHGESGGVFLLEESAPTSLRNIAGKIAKTHFNRPDIPMDVDSFNAACDRLEGKLHIWRNKGANNWENIYGCIRYWAVVKGCTFFMLDNMTTLVNHLSPTEQNTEIAKIATACAGLCDELGIRIFIFSHLNPPGGSKSHETGAEVREHQFTGSRALQRWSQLVLGFQRNKAAEGDAKHLSKIVVLKDREYGRTGSINTRYDTSNGCLVETEDSMEEGALDEPFN